ncbi:uncharacterized protein [Acropora muricata]|uniref:uncharacterized protein n=1 Tax=Acropora muricata TaxID=159855 RepID=UPI0034E4EC63
MNKADKIYKAKVQLDNRKHYERLKAPMVKTIQKKVNDLMNQLHQDDIDDMTNKWLLKTPSPPRIPILVTLTKIHKPYPLDSLGIADSPKVEDVLRHFNESVSFNKQEVQLPWKQHRPPLPSNLGLCKNRLCALLGRLGRNPEQLVNYDQIIHSQLKEGFIEKVENPYRHTGTLHYILKNIQEPIDVEGNIECYRFRRVLFGASPSLFLLGATLRNHLHRQKDDWVANDQKNSTYMDNVLSGVSDDEDAEHYYRHSRHLLASARMNLRPWTTNSSKLKEKLVAENTIATDKPKVLDLEWDSNADTISFPLMKVVSEAKALHDQLTKRSVLSIAAKVFDPLGLFEPFTVRAKMMLQELWKQKVSWDSQLPEELKPQWWALWD